MHRLRAILGRLKMMIWVVPVATVFLVTFIYFELPIWVVILLTIFLINSAWKHSSTLRLLRAEKSLNEQCNPYPLYKEAKEQLSYNRSQRYKQLLLIEYCVALRYLGEYKKAYEKLETINIDEYARTSPSIKLVYYNNMADINMCLNELGNTETWHNKSLLLLNDFKKDKQKKKFSLLIQHNSAKIAYYKQNYDKSIRILNSIPETNLRDTVEKALLFARIYIAREKNEDAKLRLKFVVEKGNKLSHVQTALELLEKI